MRTRFAKILIYAMAFLCLALSVPVHAQTPAVLPNRAEWWRNGASLDMDFYHNRYMVSLTAPVTYTSLTQFISAVSGTFTRAGANVTATGDPFYLAANQSFVSRASSATYFDSSGVMQTAATSVARADYDPLTLAYKGILIEPARTNYIGNGSFAGGVPGVVSSRSVVSGSGVIPTKWTTSGLAANNYNLNTEVVGLGTINGMSYIDLRYYGTSSASPGSFTGFYTSGVTNISTSVGQPWAGSVYLGLVGGTTTNISGILTSVSCRDSAGNGLEGSSYVDAMPSISSSMSRYSNTWTCSNTSTTYIALNTPQLRINSGPIDITLRIAAPQLENGLSPTSYIPTSGTTATRAADVYTDGFSGTYFDSTGTLRSAYAHMPRLDYDPSTLVPKGILIEEARTNLLLYSNNFSQWTIGGGVTTTQDTASPDGTVNAWTFTQVSATGTDSRRQYNLTVAANTNPYVFSVFFKKQASAPSVYPAINFFTGGYTSNSTVVVNPYTGDVLSNGTAGRYGIIDSGGYWRVWTSIDNNASNTLIAAGIYPSFSSSWSTTRSSVSGGAAVFYGAQVEAGAFPTSYIPTLGGTVARAKDIFNMPTSTGWHTQGTGTLFATAQVPMSGNLYAGIATLDDGTSDNAVQELLSNNGGTHIALEVWNAAAFTSFGGASITPGDMMKAGIAFDGTNARGVFNGLLQSATTRAIPILSTLRVGAARGNNFPLNGWVSRIVYFPTRQPDHSLPDFTR